MSTILVYQYGCGRPLENEGKASKILETCHQYFNKMVDFHNEWLNQNKGRQIELCPAIGEEYARIDRQNEILKQIDEEAGNLRVRQQTTNIEDPKLVDKKKSHRDEKKAIFARIADHRKQVIADNKEVFDAAMRKHHAGIATIKSELTGLLGKGSWFLSDNIQNEFKTKYDLKTQDGRVIKFGGFFKPFRRRRFLDSREKLYWRFKKSKALPIAPTLSDLLDGKSGHIKLVQIGEKRGGKKRVYKLSINLGTVHRPDYFSVPVTLHRMPPADAKIVELAVVRKRTANKWKWFVNFTVKHSETFKKAVTGNGVAALDFGWRTFGTGKHMLTWAGDDGAHGHAVMDESFIKALEKVNDIKSIRDRAFNDIVTKVKEFKATDVFEAASGQFKEQVAYCHSWKSPISLIRALRGWVNSRFPGDEALFNAVKEWYWEDEQHLYTYQEHLRSRLQRCRQHFQRNLVSDLRRMGYGTVILDNIDLARLQQDKDIVKAEDSCKTWSTWGKNACCHSELKLSFKNSGMVVVDDKPAGYTSRECPHCGHINKDSEATFIECHSCGERVHRDLLACWNLLQSHKGEKVSMTTQHETRFLTYKSERNTNSRARRLEKLLSDPKKAARYHWRNERRAKQHEDRRVAELAKKAQKPRKQKKVA
jgi:hypothetical protein